MKATLPAGGLFKVLGVAFGLAIVVGNTIGVGILRTPGEVAAHLPSVPWFMAVWVIGALYALLGALSVAELGAMHPRSGGQYPLVRRALGPYPGFIVGWSDWISTCGSTAAVAIVLGEYLGPLVPPLEGQEKWTAAAVVIAFTILHARGISAGDLAQKATSLVKAVALVALALVALLLGSQTEPTSVLTTSTTTLPNGLALMAAVVVAMQSAILTYDGWTGPIYFSEELKNPGRDVPKAMIGGVLLVMAIYLALNAAFLLVIPITEMAGDPFVAATAASRLFGPSGDTVIRVIMVISLIASVSALTLMASRVPYAMSQDRMLPNQFGKVNSGGTPLTSLIVGGAIALAFVLTNTFEAVLALLAFFFVASYALTFTTVFVMRRREPNANRPFRVPLFPWVPGIVLVGSIAFLVAALFSDTSNSLRALGLLLLSYPVFLAMRR